MNQLIKPSQTPTIIIICISILQMRKTRGLMKQLTFLGLHNQEVRGIRLEPWSTHFKIQQCSTLVESGCWSQSTWVHFHVLINLIFTVGLWEKVLYIIHFPGRGFTQQVRARAGISIHEVWLQRQSYQPLCFLASQQSSLLIYYSAHFPSSLCLWGFTLLWHLHPCMCLTFRF